MEPLVELWNLEWTSYNIDPIYAYIALAIVAACAYRDWQRTLLVVWVVVYAWSMTTALAPGQLDLEEGFLIVWVCGYALSGFFFLGYLFYANLK